MLPASITRQPALVRLMIGIALIILPTVAWMDYQQEFVIAAAIEIVAAVTLLGLIFTIKPLGVKRAVRVTLLTMFVLAAIGSVEKLASTPNLAWFTVMPFLYIAVGGLRLGGTLTVAHFAFIVLCYLFVTPSAIGELPLTAWIQVCLAYATASGLALSYEMVQRQLRARLRDLADHDPLTGLLNRRGMEQRMDELASYLQRHDVAVTLAVIDIDHFKRVNDEHGHDVGDAVLVEISQELTRIFRSSDYLSRWGGDEFLIALPHTSIDAAAAVLERLRSEIAAPRQLSIPAVTLSLGAAEWRPGVALAAALKQSDMALYEAKESGRNKLVANAVVKTAAEVADADRSALVHA